MARTRTVRTFAALGVALMLATSLGGCGRRGPLLPPPDPNAPPEVKADPAKGGVIHKRPPNPPIVAPNRPFILDPLL